MNRPAREFAAVIVAFLAALIVFRVALGVEERFLFQAGLLNWTGAMAIALAGVVVAVFGLAYAFSRRRLLLPPSLHIAVAVVLVPYLITWLLGVPSVLTDFTSAEVAEYKRDKAENNRVWEVHPVIRFLVAFPVAPALVLTYHEYQVAGLDGEGGWELSLWYGARSRSLWHYRLWVS
jgi:hypothetical protein